MRTTSEKISYWRKIGDAIGSTCILSLMIAFIALIAFIILHSFTWTGSAGNFTDALADIADWIAEHALLILAAPIFIIYFVLLAVLQFVGINIGIKEID